MARARKRRVRRARIVKNKGNLIRIPLKDGLLGYDAETDVTQISKETQL